MEISRGTSDDWNWVADGSANVVLSNRDRRFDPFNATGPYFGNLLPRRQIRIRATSGGTTYDVFRGFIAGWPPEWTDAGYDSTVTLSCFDALQLLGSSSLPADWSRDYIIGTNPRHYYPLDEPVISYSTTQRFKDYGNFPIDLVPATGVVSGSQVAEGLASNSVSAIGTGASTGLRTAIAATSFTVSCWAVFGDGNLQGHIGITEWAMGFIPGIDNYVIRVGDSGTVRTWVANIDIDLSAPHFYLFTYNSITKGIEMYVDGVFVNSTMTSTATATPTFESVTIVNGVFQQVCVWTYGLPLGIIQNIYNYSKALFEETTSSRISRIISETPFSASLVSSPASPASTLLDITDNAPTASSELGRVAESEFAPLFVSKAGTITQFQQNQIRTQTRSIVTQAIYGGAGLPIGTVVQLQYDGDSMRNVANVEMSGGGVYITANTLSVNTFGEAEQFVSTQVSNLSDAVDIGNLVQSWGGNVYAKASPVQVVLSPDQFWGSTLALELWDRFMLNVAPRTGSAINVPMLLTRVNHSVTPERWSTTLEGSARWAAIFILDQSLLDGTDLLT
jgi:hypothetical protein